MVEDEQQDDDDRDWHPEKPQQNGASHGLKLLDRFPTGQLL
jgi:hypothetical protein